MKTFKKILKWSLITILSIVLFIVIMALGVRFAVTIPWVQDWLKKEAVEALQDRIQSNLTIGKVSIDLWKGEVEVYELHLDDRQGESLLDLGLLKANMKEFHPLLHRYVVDEIRMEDIQANIYQEKKDSATNFQFLIDAFKKKTPRKKKKIDLSFDINDVNLSNIDVHYDLRWKKMENHITLQKLSSNFIEDSIRIVRIDSLGYQSNNHKPHRRTGRPHRGYFDAGHMNMTTNINLTVKQVNKDSFFIDLKHLEAYDKASGLRIDTLRCNVRATKKNLYVSDIFIRDNKTTVSIPQLTVDLPKKKGGEAYLKTPEIRAHAVLQDISHPFAPVLKNFTTPVLVKAPMEGFLSDLRIKKAVINTPDYRIRSVASARLMKLSKKDSMRIEIFVPRFKAVGGIKEQIIHHFKTMKSMDGMLMKAGNITVTNTFITIVRKKEFFRGHLCTAVGNADFDLGINGWTRYMHAQVVSPEINVGKLVGKEAIGVISFDATLDFDIASKRIAKLIGRHHGKLPAGTMVGTIHELNYQKLTLRNVDFDITCDGDTAKGFVDRRGRFVDLNFSFSFTNTKFEKSLKFHPKVSIHKEDKAIVAKRKARKAAEKAAKQAEKAERKAQKKAMKEKKKKQKAAQRKDTTSTRKSFFSSRY